MTRPTVRGTPALIAATTFLCAALAACGSSGDRDNPERPIVDVEVASQLVDVGQRYRLDASESFDPTGRGLEFFWTLLPPENSNAEIEDHCEDDPEQVCSDNFDACSDDTSDICLTNSDCEEPGCEEEENCDICIDDFAESSPQCDTGRCEVDLGRQGEFATFVADVPGSYTVRVLVESNEANDTGAVVLDTYPSLYLLGSLFALGGTQGGLVGEFADAETFADGAVGLITSPTTGNLILAIPGPPGRVREFDFRTGRDLGQFGETGDFVVAPIALTFDLSDRILIADSDGTVRVFDGTDGRFVRNLGDVTAGVEEVAAIAIHPPSGDLLVADGRAGQAVRRYSSATGTLVGPFGDVGTVATQAVDLAFFGDPTSALFVADAAGQLVRCDTDGLACAVVAAASTVLQANGPTSIAVNPASDATDADVLIADSVAAAVVACKSDATSCAVFGESAGLDSNYLDLAFAPAEVPEPPPPPMITTTTTSTTVP